MSIRSRLVSQPNNKLSSNTYYFDVILPPNRRDKISTNSQIRPITLDENKYFQVRTVKIILDSGASASIANKDVLYKEHKNN